MSVSFMWGGTGVVVGAYWFVRQRRVSILLSPLVVMKIEW